MFGRSVILSLLSFVFVGLISALIAVAPVHAAGGSITVTTSADEYGDNLDACSLREAITTISNTQSFGGCPYAAGVDTILLTTGSTYELTRTGADENYNVVGDLDVLASLNITASGSDNVVISAAGLGDRVIHLNPWYTGLVVNVNLSRLTIENGSSVYLGGGVLNHNAVAALDRVVVRNNSAIGLGGGVMNSLDGVMTITNSSLMSNTVSGTSAAGGGLANFNQLIVTNSSVVYNIADGANGTGGGVLAASSATELRNVTVSGNSAGRNGGGIHVDIIASQTILNNVTVVSNTAGAYNADGDGGGIYIAGYMPTIGNSVIADNLDVGADNDYPDCATSGSAIWSRGYNVFGDFASTNCTINGSSTSTGNILNPSSVMLAPLQVSYGLTMAHEPLSGSPVIQSGNPAVPGSGDPACEPTDQRGLFRPVNRCDSGAYQVGGLLKVFLPLVLR